MPSADERQGLAWLDAWFLTDAELEDWYRELPIELSDEARDSGMNLHEVAVAYPIVSKREMKIDRRRL